MYCENCGKYSGRYNLCKECYEEEQEDNVMEDLECIICGNMSFGYLFCKDCYYKYKDSVFSATINMFGELEIVDDNNSSKCIICKQEANGYNFCHSCYQKYKNKAITLKVTNCQTTELLSSAYSGKTYKAQDGHVVRSKSEREIDDYFFTRGYKHAYEKEISVNNEYGEKITLHPDFCLFKGKNEIYIEYWGYNENDVNYTSTKESKLRLYKKAGITLINLYEETDAENLTAALEYKLSNFEIGKINF